jgi:hypothetical protein
VIEPKSGETEMHTLYLSDAIWGELKRRAVIERSNASKIADYVLRTFLKFTPAIDLPRRRSRLRISDRLNRRNLHLQVDTWERVDEIAREKRYSISVLTEYLLRRYLGLAITDDLWPRPLGKRLSTDEWSPQIPQGLWAHFQEYDPARLDMERDADLIIQRTLEFGTWDEVRWLFAAYGRQRIGAFLRQWGERQLSRVTFNYWRRLLGISNWQTSPFPTAKGELWDR